MYEPIMAEIIGKINKKEVNTIITSYYYSIGYNDLLLMQVNAVAKHIRKSNIRSNDRSDIYYTKNYKLFKKLKLLRNERLKYE